MSDKETTYELIDNNTGLSLCKNANLSDLYRVLNMIKKLNQKDDEIQELKNSVDSSQPGQL